MKSIASATLLPSAEFEVVDLLAINGLRAAPLYRTTIVNPVRLYQQMLLEQFIDDEEQGVIS
jgi:hypothetical protein